MIKIGLSGFVKLVDYMGDDAAIVQAARISYGDGTKSVQSDLSLIEYLLRHNHTTPFEMVEFKFHIRVPIHIWRQWVRHRTASINEYSTRYSKAINDMEQVAPDEWRLQSTTNKQGSEGFLEIEEGKKASYDQLCFQVEAKKEYEAKLSRGITREQARNDLPMSTYTEAYWKINLHNLLHFLNLRLDPHAQKEIRDYAEAILQLITPIVPVAISAFECYTRGAIKLSQREIRVINSILVFSDKFPLTEEEFLSHSNLIPEWNNKAKCRERNEFAVKLKRLGFIN